MAGSRPGMQVPDEAAAKNNDYLGAPAVTDYQESLCVTSHALPAVSKSSLNDSGD